MASMMKILPIVTTIAAIALAPETGGMSLEADAALSGGEAAAGMASVADTASAVSTFSDISSLGSNVGEGLSTLSEGGTVANTAADAGSLFSSVSPYLKAASVVGQVGGIAGQVIGENQQAKAATSLANFQATQLNNNANAQMGAAEMAARNQDQQTAYVTSNATAAAAASGGSATDPTVVSTMKTIAGQGRYRALTDMYNGAVAAAADRNNAIATQYGAAQGAAAAKTRQYSTILSGASALYDKYGTVDDKNKGNTYNIYNS